MNTQTMINDMLDFGRKCGVTWFWNYSDDDPQDIQDLKRSQEEGAVLCMVGLYGKVLSHQSIRFHVMEGWKDAVRTLMADEDHNGQRDLNIYRPTFRTDPQTGRITRVTWSLRKWTVGGVDQDPRDAGHVSGPREVFLLDTLDLNVPFRDRRHYYATKVDGTPLGTTVDLDSPWVNEG